MTVMDAKNSAMIPDVQSEHDSRRLPIDRVGVKRLRYPICFADKDGVAQTTIATCAAYVRLPADQKGTHMSRLVTLFEEMREQSVTLPLTVGGLQPWLELMLERLEVTSGQIELDFAYFVRKKAPASGIESTMDYQVRLTGMMNDGHYSERVEVDVPVTSLCPCSKKISEYGAHNQRSLVTLGATLVQPVFVMDFIRIAEEEASSELYAILKRADEKYVTEYAYDHPCFVEDLVRAMAQRMAADTRLETFTVDAENFESIHNHSAYAHITAPAAGSKR